jgi:uncharacterized OB-fold protein
MPSPRYWREVPSRLRLEAARCTACGKVCYPPRPVCPKCGATSFEPITLSKSGTIVTSTVIHIAPSDFLFEAPYAMAIVETPEGARLMAQVVDCDPATVMPGLKVGLEFRRIRAEARSGILCYGYKAVPVPARA